MKWNKIYVRGQKENIKQNKQRAEKENLRIEDRTVVNKRKMEK